MKITATFFALFLLSAIISSAVAEPIYDTDGGEMENGGVYNILPLKQNRDGVMSSRTGAEECDVSVVLAPTGLSKPVRISSRVGTPFIYEHLNLDIAFQYPPQCAPKPSFWSLVRKALPEHPEALTVKLSGVYMDTVEGYFRFAKRGRGYKIQFFPLDGANYRTHTLGVKNDEAGQEQLAAIDVDEPLTVVFKRAGPADHDILIQHA